MDTARKLECDESEERFDAALKKVAAHKAPKVSNDASKAEAKQSREPLILASGSKATKRISIGLTP